MKETVEYSGNDDVFILYFANLFDKLLLLIYMKRKQIAEFQQQKNIKKKNHRFYTCMNAHIIHM